MSGEETRGTSAAALDFPELFQHRRVLDRSVQITQGARVGCSRQMYPGMALVGLVEVNARVTGVGSGAMQSQSAPVEGIVMRWEEDGEGLPLVLLHGIPTCLRPWRHVIPRITGARCLAWELVGYGASIPEGRNHDVSMGRQADYLISWLRHLGIDRAVLAGHDLGGGVAHIAAIRHPEICAGLLITNAIGYDSWPIPSVKTMQTLEPVVRHLPDSLFELIFRSFLSRGHDRSDQADEAFEVHWPNYSRHGGTEAFVREVESLPTADALDVADRLRLLNLPARVVWGTA